MQYKTISCIYKERLLRFFNKNLAMTFLFFFILNPAYAEFNDKDFKIGGQFNNSFALAKADRQRTSGVRMSGYIWGMAEHSLQNGHKVSADFGGALEYLQFEDKNALLINQTSLAYRTDKIEMIMGRTLSAAGRLHHDMGDYGAGGVGIDNNPVSYFLTGNFTGNVAQKIAQPFAPRVALYAKPMSWMGLGFSYAPYITEKHPANYYFYAGPEDKNKRTGKVSAVKNELSGAITAETKWRGHFLGATLGGTMANSQVKRFHDPKNFNDPPNTGSKIALYAYQTSLYMRDDDKDGDYTLYDFSFGCLASDYLQKECRAGFQISDVIKNWTYSRGFQIRKKGIGENYHDYSLGISYNMGHGLQIGAESITRLKQEKDFSDGDFYWVFGVSQKF